MKLKNLLGYLLFTIVSVVTLVIFGLHFLYKPVTTGTLYLKNAKGEAEVLREVDTSIPHIFASNEAMAIYT